MNEERVNFTGTVRIVDEIGRIVLPKKIRDRLGIVEGDSLEFFVLGDCILLHKRADKTDRH